MSVVASIFDTICSTVQASVARKVDICCVMISSFSITIMYLRGLSMQIEFSSDNIDISGLYPFILMRRVEDMRVGIFTIREKWERLLKAADACFIVSANLLPTPPLIQRVAQLQPGQCLFDAMGNALVECVSAENKVQNMVVDGCARLEFSWQLFQYNSWAIALDFELMKQERTAQKPDASVLISNEAQVLIEAGAVVKHTIINSDEGPVFIEAGALVMEGCLLRGPLYIGRGAVVKMGTKIYGATTVGANCTVGGEIKNSVLFANSNKAHDGYLGDAVIGEWCNLGAGTSNSNLKNTAGIITIYVNNEPFVVGQKCGVLMGDFSRTAINTSINSGTVVGVSANVFGNGLTPRHIPSFSWGFDDTVKYRLDKALRDVAQWKKFKKADLSELEIEHLTRIYNSKI